MNDENLIKPKDLTPSQRRENAKKAGKASGKARHERAQMRDILARFLEMPLRPGGQANVGSLEGAEGKNVTVAESILLTMLAKAEQGDIRAAEFVRDTSGQSPQQRMEVTMPRSEAADALRDEIDGLGET